MDTSFSFSRVPKVSPGILAFLTQATVYKPQALNKVAPFTDKKTEDTVAKKFSLGKCEWKSTYT